MHRFLRLLASDNLVSPSVPQCLHLQKGIIIWLGRLSEGTPVKCLAQRLAKGDICQCYFVLLLSPCGESLSQGENAYGEPVLKGPARLDHPSSHVLSLLSGSISLGRGVPASLMLASGQDGKILGPHSRNCPLPTGATSGLVTLLMDCCSSLPTALSASPTLPRGHLPTHAFCPHSLLLERWHPSSRTGPEAPSAPALYTSVLGTTSCPHLGVVGRIPYRHPLCPRQNYFPYPVTAAALVTVHQHLWVICLSLPGDSIGPGPQSTSRPPRASFRT